MIEAEEVSALKNDLCLLSLLAISLSRIFCDGLMNPKLRADIVSKVLQLLESEKIFFIIAKHFSTSGQIHHHIIQTKLRLYLNELEIKL